MLAGKFLAPSPKKIADKSRSPEETISLVEERLKNFGAEVFSELKRIDKGRLGIPVYISVYGADGLKITGNVKQMGKGSNESLARASALMELVERFSLFWTVKNNDFPLEVYSETQNVIPGEVLLSSVIDPDDDKKATEICAKVLPKVPFHMAKAFDVYQEREVKLPFYWFWLLYEYNGSAAGNTYAEAGVQATCELIERHTSALASRAKEPFKEIDLDRISQEAKNLLACFERLGAKLFLRDITYDMPVPTIAAMAYDPSTFPHHSELVYTAGTATSPDRALIRALTEVAQLAGDFDTDGKYLESGLPKYQTLEEAEIIVKAQGKIKLSELPDVSFEDHALELKVFAQKLAEKGYHLFLLDIACPGIDIPAVYAVVPGIYFRERIFLNPLYQLVRTVSLYLPPEKAFSILKEIYKEIDRYYVAAYLGRILMALGHYHEAAETLERALSLKPKFDDIPAIYCHLAYVFLQAEEYQKAEKAAEKGLTYGTFPELLNILGTARFKQGKPDAALESYLQAVALNPQEPREYANIGACLAALGLKEEAFEYFEKARTLDPAFDLAPYTAYLQGGTNV
ncbi:YcaO-like family protein [Thermodesulfatator atlanticus]|uniref:YcaO-like family protein n=1 Tax=Thermodesulfatator atlanticus TaxID=501497 RepID=UPI0003B60824|nr:YcaO-like family protein [Thermodesulfatator atlanticus]